MRVIIVGSYLFITIVDVYDHLSTPSRGNEQVNKSQKNHGARCMRKIIFVFSCLIALVSLVFGSQTGLLSVHSLSNNHI